MASVTGASLTDWQFDPQIVLVIALLALLYARGFRGTMRLLPRDHRLRPRLWRAASFYCSLALAIVAFESPIEALSRSYMWAHMVQHLLLIMLVAPLALLGDPILLVLRGLPVTSRRPMLTALTQMSAVHQVMRGLRWISRPKIAFLLFALTFYSWHLVPLYNATLTNQAIHDLEHASFLSASLLLWWQVIDQTGARATLGYLARAVYMFLAAIENHILALILSLSTTPFYAYKNLSRPSGAISALTDQQIAGGIMWVPGMLLFGLAFAVFFYKWLQQQASPRREPMLNISSTGQILPFEQPA